MSALLQPCHPIPGLYTSTPGALTYIVDDFGNAVHVFANAALGDQWIEHLLRLMDREH